jgi:hypothetical protein
LAKGVFTCRFEWDVERDGFDLLERAICLVCVERWAVEGPEVLRTSLGADSAIEPEVLRTSLRVYGHWPVVSASGFSSLRKMVELSVRIECCVKAVSKLYYE